jgi:hypothetical protein
MPAPAAAVAGSGMASAGGSIISTLMEGLLKMKMAEDAQKYNEYQSWLQRQQGLENQVIQAPIQASQAQSNSLQNLMSVWGRR